MSCGIADRCDWLNHRYGDTVISGPSTTTPEGAGNDRRRGGIMEIIRNLTRRKLRNTLTISGIVIGVLALVTMGAMAEKFNALIDGGVAYFGSNIQVTAAGASAFGGSSLIPQSQVSQGEQVPGVPAPIGEIQVPAKPGAGQTGSIGIP